MSATFHYLALFVFLLLSNSVNAQEKRIYTNSLSSKDSMQDWVMEGLGTMEFEDGWMQLFSPNEKGHHVLWLKKDIPNNFKAEWEVKNLNTKAGLCIVFFATTGINSEDIFATSLPKRNGNFKQYINGAIKNYHISYYANAKNEPGREVTHLRKNPGFQLVQTGNKGIPVQSQAIHKITLIKQKGVIQLFVDDRKVIDWQDQQDILGKGKIGFRQMKWTRFAYRNLKIWEL